jgi:integrase
MAGHVRRRGKNSFELKWELPRDPRTGKRVTRYKSFNGTKKAAQAELLRITASLNSGGYVDPHKITVAEFLIRWLNDSAAPTVSARTHELYQEIVDDRLIPALGSARLSELHPLHIQETYSSWLKEGRVDGKGGLSPRTVLHFHKVLYQALEQAVKWHLLTRNPCRDARAPKPRAPHIITLSVDELVTLIDRVLGTQLYIPILLAGTAGLRRGEILGLKWGDIDFDASLLRVNRSLEQTKKGLLLKPPKSARGGARTITLPKITVDGLRQHLVEQKKDRLRRGKEYVDLGLVCPCTKGTFWNPRNMSRVFKRLIDSTDLPPVALHGLRHSHITHLLKANVHPKIASERAGHSSVAITMDVYSHAVPDMQREAAEKIDEMMRVKPPK